MLTAIVVIGRVGARITAELGTMQVSEQIDALYSLGRDPVSVLAAPRIIAGMPAMLALVGHRQRASACMAGMVAAQTTREPRLRELPLRRRACSGTATTSSTRS